MIHPHPTARVTIVGRESADIVGRVTIGREPNTVAGHVMWVPEDVEMSRAHASIEVVNGVAMAIDLGSRNGTFLSGPSGRVQVPRDYWIPVPPDAQLQIGNHWAQVQVLAGEPGPVYWAVPAAPGAGARGWLVPVLVGVVGLLGVLLAVLVVGSLASTGGGGGSSDGDERGASRDDGEVRAERAESEVDSDESVVADDQVAGVGDGRFGESARPPATAREVIAPEPVAARWTRPITGVVDSNVLVDGDVVYVSSIAAGRAVAAGVARIDGVERWSAELGTGSEIDGVGVVDGVAVIQVCGLNCDVFALDADGTQLWTAPVSERGVIVANSRLYFSRSGVIDVIDARTGAIERSVSGDFATFGAARPATQVEVSGGWELTWFDFELRPVLGPIVLETSLLPFADFDGSSLVIAGSNNRLDYWNERGEVIREVALGPLLDIEALLAVGSDLVVIEIGSGSLIGFDTSETPAIELWRNDTGLRLSEVILTDAGPVVSASFGAVGLSGVDGVEVLDARTGELISRVDPIDDITSRRVATQFGANAFVVVDRDSGTGIVEVRVTEWSSRQELWRQTFDGFVTVAQGGGLTLMSDGELTFFE